MPTQQQIKVVKKPVKKGQVSTRKDDTSSLDGPLAMSNDGPFEEEKNHFSISMNTRSRTRKKTKDATSQLLKTVSHNQKRSETRRQYSKTKQSEKIKNVKKADKNTITVRNRRKATPKKFIQHELIKPLQNNITEPEPILSNNNISRRISFLAKQERKNLQQGKRINKGKIKGVKSIHSQNDDPKDRSDYSPSKGSSVSMEVASKRSEDTHEKNGMDLNASHLNVKENANKQDNYFTESHKASMDQKKREVKSYRKLPHSKNVGSLDQQTDQHNFLSKMQRTDHFSSGSNNNAMIENKPSSPIHLNPSDHNSVPPQIEKIISMEQIEREKRYLEEYLNSKKTMSDNFVDIQPRPTGTETDYRTQALLLNKQSQRRSHTRGNYKCGFCGAMKKDHACPTDLFVFDKAVQTDKNITMTDKDKVIIVREIVKDCS